MSNSQETIRKEWEAANAVTASAESHNPVENESEIVGPEIPNNLPEEAPIAKPDNPDKPDKPDFAPTREHNENFRRLKEQNRELERRLEEMERKQSSKSEVKDQPEELIEDYDLRDDDITEGKHYKALKKQVKSLNEAILKERAERDKLAAEARLRANYPDIFNVITKENMEELAKVEPELVESIISSPNTYAQHVSAYKLIKKYGIGTQDPYAEDKARVQKNMTKPRSSASVAPRMGESPLADAERFANGLTPELQSQLLREMEDAIANR